MSEVITITATFDDRSVNWSQVPEYNALFLRAQCNYANDVLKSRGHIFLNEVYDMLGLPRTTQGQLVGWIFPNTIEFWEGELDCEGDISLTFNVEGVIYDKIEVHA